MRLFPASRFRTRAIYLVNVALLTCFATGLFASDRAKEQSPSLATLVQTVRLATWQFQDVNKALAAGYAPFLGCVSGSDHGAMGIHYVNGTLVGDGQIDVWHPEALIYEPVTGNMQLVGVEYIVDAATWLAGHNNVPPVLEGQTFQLIGIPNRYNIPAPFFELHVWAWRDNPLGAFVDWNDHVSCEHE